MQTTALWYRIREINIEKRNKVPLKMKIYRVSRR